MINYDTIIFNFCHFCFSCILSFSEVNGELTVHDDNYLIERYADGIDFPTTMDFIGNDLLVLEKNTGKIIRINENGEKNEEPILTVPVSGDGESGLLGIATVNDKFSYILQKVDRHMMYIKEQKMSSINMIGLKII